MNRIIEELEKEQLKKDVPRFKVGDTVRVAVRVEEGGKTRTQNFEGTVIKRKGSGIRSSFTVRRISFGEGVERNFPVHSPSVQTIEVLRGGKVRRAKLFYLRESKGKRGKIEQERREEQETVSE